ncbi:helix-turn-helix transcriptional regulator [Geomicrobium sp. JCM 19037]|uniref:helix-turn-helix domain-containing protein n=1 Tax=Geomicrobium sp. JCM 19037 TaxID=1460634 RepID=UPI0005A9F063|nr:helix-turn-helix transcriptional regulator [Geomicrobium sp. JCM 19037]
MYRVGKCRLAEHLYSRGMTQTDLAIKTGYSTSTISDYINNKRRMGIERAMNISSALNCSIDDLYDWVKE